MTADVARAGSHGVVATPVSYTRRKRRIKGSSIATLVFLAMCAAFMAIPLYVVIVTSFKTMQQVTLGEIFALPTTWTLVSRPLAVSSSRSRE